MEQESFRNSIGTVDTSGKRVWVFPKKPKWALLPLSQVCELSAIDHFLCFSFSQDRWKSVSPFNILERRFNIFGFPFWPQDFYLFCAFHDYRSGLYPALYGGFWTYFLWVDLSTDDLP